MDDPDIKDILSYIYTPRKYSVVIDIINNLERLTDTTELIDNIEKSVKFYIMTNRQLPTQEYISVMIHDYVEVNVVNKIFNIILEDTNTVDIYFLSGITKLSLCLDKYSEAYTVSILEYINSDLDTYSMLGYIISTIQPEFYTYDIIDIVKNIPYETIEEIKIRTDYIMDLEETNDEQLEYFYSAMTKLDQSVIKSKLFNYIIKYNNYDISDRSCLAYISSIAENGDIDDNKLGLELLVFASLKHKDSDYMVNIIDTVFPNNNRHDIIYFLNNRLSGYEHR